MSGLGLDHRWLHSMDRCPVAKAGGGGSFPPSLKEVPRNTAFVCKDIRAAHRAALVPLSVPSGDGNGV